MSSKRAWDAHAADISTYASVRNGSTFAFVANRGFGASIYLKT